MFDDLEAGRKIFRGRLKRFGKVDRDHPDWYRLAVGYRDADVLDSGARFLGLSAKFLEINPRDSDNLEQVLQRYQRMGLVAVWRVAVEKGQPVRWWLGQQSSPSVKR